MSESASFRRSLNGFNRDDVNDYIVAMNRRHSADNNALMKRIEELSSEVSLLKEENDRLVSVTPVTPGDPAAVSDSPAELSEDSSVRGIPADRLAYEDSSGRGIPADRLAYYEKENARLSEELDAARERLRSAESEISRLSESLADSRALSEDDERKLLLYDKLSSQVGDILLSASDSADEIVRSARLEASRITDSARDMLGVFESKYAEMTRRLAVCKASVAKEYEPRFKHIGKE